MRGEDGDSAREDRSSTAELRPLSPVYVHRNDLLSVASPLHLDVYPCIEGCFDDKTLEHETMVKVHVLQPSEGWNFDERAETRLVSVAPGMRRERSEADAHQ